MNTPEASPAYGQVWRHHQTGHTALVRRTSTKQQVTYSYRQLRHLPDNPTNDTFKKAVLDGEIFQRRRFHVSTSEFKRKFRFSHIWV